MRSRTTCDATVACRPSSSQSPQVAVAVARRRHRSGNLSWGGFAGLPLFCPRFWLPGSGFLPSKAGRANHLCLRPFLLVKWSHDVQMQHRGLPRSALGCSDGCASTQYGAEWKPRVPSPSPAALRGTAYAHHLQPQHMHALCEALATNSSLLGIDLAASVCPRLQP